MSVSPHRRKGAGADVQRDEGMPHVPSTRARQKLRRRSAGRRSAPRSRPRCAHTRSGSVRGPPAPLRARCREAAESRRGLQKTPAHRKKTPNEIVRPLCPTCARFGRPRGARPRRLAGPCWRGHGPARYSPSARAREGFRPVRRSSFVPKTRAGITRVSLNTKRSLGSSSDGKSRNCRSRQDPDAPSRANSRLTRSAPPRAAAQ